RAAPTPPEARRPGIFHATDCNKLSAYPSWGATAPCDRRRRTPMNDILLASSAEDADAVHAIEQHHAELAGALTASVEALLTAAASDDAAAVARARGDLVSWARRELVPHALAEESQMYPAAQSRDESRLLIESMLAEHKAIVALVDEVE